MSLSDPFDIAKFVRYSDDEFEDFSITGIDKLIRHESLYTHGCLRISAEITPTLSNNLNIVCKRLKVPINMVKAFVLSRPDINAHCIHFEKKGCIIALNSELINLMSDGEIQFTMGHEIGHFLMNHNYFDDDPKITEQESTASRAGEISSDRIGLLACKDVDVAIKAMIRFQSGLSDSFLRFDTGAFLSETKNETMIRSQLDRATHPSARIRADALLRFSLSKPYQLLINDEKTGTKLEDVDKHIKKELDTYFDLREKSFFESLFD
tara:strand:+ start:310 stop:1107 length:798 start_codon:yes stop_codon:yes gene_type:complete